MGQVYLAERVDGGVSQKVAIKLVRGAGVDAKTHGGKTDSHYAARFNIERQVLARLKHPNIAALIDAGALASGELWIAMEYVDGQTLDQYVLRHEISRTQIVKLLSTLAHTVGYAERQLIVHRDLKPSNIMIDQHGALKLLDFGIAKLLGPSHTAEITQIQPFSPRYAAPEQLRNGTITTATNVYQLGVLARDLLMPPLDADLAALVRCALQDQASDRYANAGAMALDFDAWLANKPLKVRQLNLLAQVLKFAQRQPIVSAALAAAVSGVILFAWIASTQAQLAQESLRLVQSEQRSSEAVIEKLRAGFSSISPSTAGKPALLSDLLEYWRVREAGSDLHADGRVMALAGELSFALGDYAQARALLTKALQEIEPKRSESSIKDAARAAGLLAWIDNVQGNKKAAIASTETELNLLAQLPASIYRDLPIGKAQYLRLSYKGQLTEAAEVAQQTAEKLLAGNSVQKTHRLVFISYAYQSFLAANSVDRANQMAALLKLEISQTTSAAIVENMLPNEIHGNDGLFDLLEVANAVGRSGDRKFAEALLAELARAGQGAFGADHPFAAQFNAAYALALLNSGKLRLANDFNLQALNVIAQHSTQFPQLWQGTLSNQGAIARALGDPESAAECYLKSTQAANKLQDERGALLAMAQRLRALAELQRAQLPDKSIKSQPDLVNVISAEYADFMMRWLKSAPANQNNEARFAVATASAIALDDNAKSFWQADLTALNVPESARFKRELALIYLLRETDAGAAVEWAKTLLNKLPAGTALISQYSLMADAALWRLAANSRDLSALQDAELAYNWLRVEQLPGSLRLRLLKQAIAARAK